jgi:CubicO group peptidase (beta-lactamase class C family)
MGLVALVILLTSVTVLAPATARADPLNDLHTSGAGLDWVEYHNATADFHKAQKDALKADHRLISLSLAGSVAAPRYAAVWVKAAAPDQHFMDILNAAGNPCCSKDNFTQKISDELGIGYSPTLVTAVGDDELSAKYAAVFERTASATALLVSYSASDFASLNKNMRNSYRVMLRWAAVFGTSTAPVYYGLYEPLSIPGSTDKANKGFPRWVDTTTQDAQALYAQFGAYEKEWVRPGVLAGAPDGTIFASWYDSLLTASTNLHPVQAYVEADLDAANLDTLIASFRDIGWFPMQVQAVERKGSLHYNAIMADESSVIADPDRRFRGLPRKFFSMGLPDLASDSTLQPFQDHMKKFMLNHGVRAASLAVAKDGRLVFAHAYTWAEIDGGYPKTTPNNRFRVGSVSKVFTMVLACKLEENGVLSLGDHLIDDLASPPSPKDSRFPNITLRDLIAHRSGLLRAAADPPVISEKLNGAIILPITRAEQTKYEIEFVKLQSDPGQEYHYSNLAYYFAGEAGAHQLGGGTGYDAAVRDIVFAPLFPSTHHPEVTKSTFEDQSPDEVRYHTHNLQLVTSVVDSAQPLVPIQYGGNDYNLKAASGGWSASAAQLAKVMALFSLPPGFTNPLLDASHLSSTGNGMLAPLKLDGGVIDPSKTMGGLEVKTTFLVSVCGIPTGVVSYGKNGGVPGVKAQLLTRTDGLTIAVVVTGDTTVPSCNLNEWAAEVDWSKVPKTTDYFPTYNIFSY